MGQIVYADLLFLVNFSMDFLCFFVTARILSRPFKVWRCIVASAMGGVYSVLLLFVNIHPSVVFLADLGFCALMCLAAYGIKDKSISEFLLHITVYFGVSMGTGGCMTAMFSLLNRAELPLSDVKNNPDGISVWLFGLLALASGAVAMLGGKMFKTVSSDTVSLINIHYKGASLAVRGMVDTGNMLKDPISGRPVIIVDSSALSGMVSLPCVELAMKGDIAGIIAKDPSHNARLIPMKTASGHSVVCAFVPDKITVSALNKNGRTDKKAVETDALFAPAKLCLSRDRSIMGCAALVPSGVIN